MEKPIPIDVCDSARTSLRASLRSSASSGLEGGLFGKGTGIPRAVQFLLYVTLPIFSAHAFLVLSFILAGIFVFQPTSRRTLFAFVGAALIPASGLMYLITGRFSSASGLRWMPGWMQADGGLYFWILNFGITLPLLFILLVMVSLRGDSRSRSFCLPALGIFAICFLFAFAPWEWDNTKMLLWAWLVCAPFIWHSLIAPLPQLFRIILCFALFAVALCLWLGASMVAMDTNSSPAQNSQRPSWHYKMSHEGLGLPSILTSTIQ